MINIGLIGCGYISYYYCISFTNYDNIHLVGVYDRNKDKRDKLSDKFGCKSFNTLDELLLAENVHMIINLTNPKAHFELNQKILCAGKHLYCEKPISLSLQDFDILTELSQKHNVQILSAPANYLSNAFKLLKDNIHKIGNIELVKASILEEDNIPYDKLSNPLGSKWNIQDELNTGCNLEHSGYLLSILLSLLKGEINSLQVKKAISSNIKSFGSLCYASITPDIYKSQFKVGNTKVIMSTSIVSKTNNKMIIFYGSNGFLQLENVWDFNSKIVHNGQTLTPKNDHFKNDWALKMDLGRPIHLFDKGEKLMDIKDIRRILSLMLDIQNY